MPSPEVIDLTLSDDEIQPDPIRSDQGPPTPTQATNRFRTSSSTPLTSGINRTRRILPVIQGTFAAIERAENYLPDRIPSTTPGADPPRDARDSGSARSHSTHLETSSSDRHKWSPTRSSTRYQDQISVKCTSRTLRMPSFTRAAHAQPSPSNFPRRDSNFGERTRSRGTTLGERNFPTSPQNKITKLTHCSIYVPMRTISTPQTK